jgi:hypothetical protein
MAAPSSDTESIISIESTSSWSTTSTSQSDASHATSTTSLDTHEAPLINPNAPIPLIAANVAAIMQAIDDLAQVFADIRAMNERHAA